MNDKEIKQYLDQGYLQINVLFEIVGNPKEYVAKALDEVMKRIEDEKGIAIISSEKGAPEDAGDGLWGTYCEAELLVKDLRVLSWLSFNFMPASIEIKAPSKLTIKDKEMTDFVGDLIAQVHDANKKIISTNSNNLAMLKSINGLMRNSVLIALGAKERTAAEIAKMIGITAKDIEPLLTAMISEKTISKKGTKYICLVKAYKEY
jgi:hypothetical protein